MLPCVCRGGGGGSKDKQCIGIQNGGKNNFYKYSPPLFFKYFFDVECIISRTAYFIFSFVSCTLYSVGIKLLHCVYQCRGSQQKTA